MPSTWQSEQHLVADERVGESVTDQLLDTGRICDANIGLHRDKAMYGAITVNAMSCIPTKYWDSNRGSAS